MWFGVYKNRKDPKFINLVERYEKFLPEDYVVLCPNHHAEIHRLYDNIIKADKRQTGRTLRHYTWAQMEVLMDKLESACNTWIELSSPGIDNNYFAATRKRKQ